MKVETKIIRRKKYFLVKTTSLIDGKINVEGQDFSNVRDIQQQKRLQLLSKRF